MTPPSSHAPHLRIVPAEPPADRSPLAARLEDALWRCLECYPWVRRITSAEDGRCAPPGQLPTQAVRRVRLGDDALWLRVCWEGDEPWRKELVLMAVRAAEHAVREEDLRRERGALWQRFESLRQRSVERDRMTAIGTMAAGVAHDIRNPLSVLVGNLAYLEDLVSELPGVRDELASISEDNRLALELIEGVLDSMRTFVQMKDVSSVLSVEPILHSCLRLSRWHFVRARARAQLAVEGEPTVCATAGELSQILMNLLSNAAVASPEGGVVRVGAAQLGDRTHLWVADDGPGVSPEQAEAIFEPFHTTKPKGMGLGLSVAREMAERHGGTLRLLASTPPQLGSRPVRGACFELVLPAAADA